MAKSKNGICYIEFQYKQIGMDESYFKEMVRVLEGNKVKIKREVLIQRIRGAADSPFDEDDLNAVNDNRGVPIKQIAIKKIFILNVYEEIHKEYPYILAVDPSTGVGVGSDNTAMNIIDPYTLKSIATLVTPYADPVETSEIIVELVTKYVPKCMLVIERNSLGAGIIALIARTPVAANMYYDPRKAEDIYGEGKLNKKGYLEATASSRRAWGFITSNKNREIMLNEMLTNYVKNHKEQFISTELIDDLNNLYVKSSGRIEARPGTHDDVVMSYMIGCYVYEHGYNTSQWGISKTMRMLGRIDETKKKDLTYAEIYEDLPDDVRELFPKPGESINLLNREAALFDDNISDDGAKNNEIYQTIQKVQHARTRRIQQNDGSNVVVRSNVTADDMVRAAALDETNGIDDDIIDICNILNED
jgi:hypothetical protein